MIVGVDNLFQQSDNVTKTNAAKHEDGFDHKEIMRLAEYVSQVTTCSVEEYLVRIRTAQDINTLIELSANLDLA